MLGLRIQMGLKYFIWSKHATEVKTLTQNVVNNGCQHLAKFFLCCLLSDRDTIGLEGCWCLKGQWHHVVLLVLVCFIYQLHIGIMNGKLGPK